MLVGTTAQFKRFLVWVGIHPLTLGLNVKQPAHIQRMIWAKLRKPVRGPKVRVLSPAQLRYLFDGGYCGANERREIRAKIATWPAQDQVFLDGALAQLQGEVLFLGTHWEMPRRFGHGSSPPICKVHIWEVGHEKLRRESGGPSGLDMRLQRFSSCPRCGRRRFEHFILNRKLAEVWVPYRPWP